MEKITGTRVICRGALVDDIGLKSRVIHMGFEVIDQPGELRIARIVTGAVHLRKCG